MPLLQLPTELLENIFQRLQHESDLCSLTKTCRRIYNVANPLLYWRNYLMTVGRIWQKAKNDGKDDIVGAAEGICRDSFGTIDVLTHLHDTPPSKLSALAWATENNGQGTLRRAILTSVDVAAICRLEYLLHVAAREDNPAVVTLFLSLDGVEIDYKDRDGRSALHHAAMTNSVESAGLLLELGASLATKCNYGETPLHIASRKGSLDTMRLLIGRGADITAKRMDLGTPLACASSQKSCAPVELLLRHGADANTVGIQGLTPLMYAARTGSAEVITALLAHGADSSATLSDGRSALQLALEIPNIPAATALMDKAPATMHLTRPDGTTILMTQARKGKRDAVKLLLGRGADIEAVDANGFNALSLAVVHRQPEMAELLLQRGANVACCGTHGQSLVALAVGQGDARIVRLLLEPGASPAGNAADDHAPLTLARNLGRSDIADILLAYGVAGIDSQAAKSS